ncbi:MAG: glutathione peroxidase [Rickettsiaceae bacterium]|nr:glutathione peroxidase [Rickettsiaceae bacterium]
MSIYDISFENGKTGEKINLSDYKGKLIMIVNTASMCGFAKQFGALQELWGKYKDKGFILIAVPTNDFWGQEPKSDQEIVSFCEVNFGINFQVAKKVTMKGEDAHPIFQLIKKDFGSASGPFWNFYKYVYSPEGKPLNWFSSIRAPNSKRMKTFIEKNLPPHE